ncbi:MAG TPA: flagellar type III secretion system pore protein FliP [Alphaproteobacteria bacterium]|nr:flagellar type III secretion system pore protein FliP [Alphaproteobacteria bacterium]
MHTKKTITATAALLALPALTFAQSSPLNINVGTDMLSSTHLFQVITLVTLLSVAPSLLLMVTSFTRLVVVFAFLRSALGLQTTPPNAVMVSLALFLTSFIMAPTLQASYTNGVAPYLDNKISAETAFNRGTEPFKRFMLANVREDDLGLFIGFIDPKSRAAIHIPAPKQTSAEREAAIASVPLQALIPAFMISELRRAFEIGFLLFLPFLIIDLTVASILMSMGMMMLPPVTIALPFKVVFFVLVDGWHLLAGTLVESFKPAL